MTLKSELITQAQKLDIETDKLTVVQLKQAILKAQTSKTQKTSKSIPDDLPPKQSSSLQTENEDVKNDDKTTFTKAGQRSRKNVLAAEAEAERLARKQTASKTPAKTSIKIPNPTRSRAERRSKKYKQAQQKIKSDQVYELDEALKTILQTSTTKFDSSLDLVIALGVDLKKPDHNIRDFVVLPHGLGKSPKIAVLADDKEAQQALDAGATIAGKEIFLQQLDSNLINFDILIAMPHLMAGLSKYAKILGPKNLMPSAKAGTVTKDVVKAVKEIKQGRLQYRVSENGLVHLMIGKTSFGATKLTENLKVILSSLQDNKPTGLKGPYIKSMHLSTTMGPSLQMSPV